MSLISETASKLSRKIGRIWLQKFPSTVRESEDLMFGNSEEKRMDTAIDELGERAEINST